MKVKYQKKEYEIPDPHPAANCLPWHTDRPEFAELIESVRSGYDDRKPIITQANTELIVSGRRRALACIIAGVDPVTETVDWTDEQVIEYVRRDELIRRNLTETQRAAALTELASLNGRGANQYEKQAKEDVPRGTSSKKRREIAEESGAGARTVARLARVKKTAPELLPVIREGKLDATTAERAADELTPSEHKRIANADDPKAEAKKLLAKPDAEAKPKQADKGTSFPFGANAPADAEPDPYDPPDDDPDAFCTAVARICRDIDVYIKRIRHLEKHRYARTVMLSTAIQQIEAARRQLWINQPTHECSYCQGNDNDCRACKGTGRLSKEAHARGEKAMSR